MIRQPRIPRPGFFRARAPKGFEYTPLTYDPEKERLKELKRRMQSAREGVFDEQGTADRIKEGIRKRRSAGHTNWPYLIRLVVILGSLLWIIKYVLSA